MNLRTALGGIDGIDPTRPLTLGPLLLGEQAAQVAAAILAGDEPAPSVSLCTRSFRRPVYWSIEHSEQGRAELFGFPEGWTEALPTDTEVALVRAIAGLQAEHHDSVFRGGAELIVGSLEACKDFRRVAEAADSPMVGQTTILDAATSVFIQPVPEHDTRTALDCLLNSYVASPLKYRFLELYRAMEALFLADVRRKLLNDFDKGPSAALSEAQSALQSEVAQIVALAEPHKEHFEECWSALDAIKNTNRFVSALFRRLAAKKLNTQGNWQSGAALIYQIRCAVVHAGEKDVIFDKFSDGDFALSAILPKVENVVLRMVGITLSN